jgi:hypothetical protein
MHDAAFKQDKGRDCSRPLWFGLLLRGLVEVGSGGSVCFGDALGEQVECALALGRRLIGGEKVVETAVFLPITMAT